MQGRTAAVEVGRDVKELSTNAVIIAGGIVTTLLTVGLNWALEHYGNYNFLSLSLWFIIPAGAAIGGFCAASGYYFAARLTQTMPSRSLLFNMVAVGLSAWILVHWLDYITATFSDGSRVADAASFWRYFQVTTEHTSLTISMRSLPLGNTGELGSAGYWRELLQLLGFMVGGFIIYGMLTEVEACAACRRYAKTKELLTNANGNAYDSLLQRADLHLPGSVEQAQAAIVGKRFTGLTLTLATCTKCHSQWVRPAVVIQSGRTLTTKRLGAWTVTPEHAAALLNPPAELPPASEPAT